MKENGSRWLGYVWLSSVLYFAIGGTLARASLTVLVGEPFGKFGTAMPVGHTAIYLDRVCADGPLKVRMCSPDEQPGVVLARYHSIGKYDWLATPVMQFLYARNHAEDVPAYVTPKIVWQMREIYRERYLRAVVPDGSEGRFYGDGRAAGAKDLEEWWESAGMAYNRRVWAYQVNTTPEQDRHLVEVMNADPNRHLYHLNKTNCADFIANLINMYYPGAVRIDHIADFGLMTPKEVARSLTDHADAHPALELKVWEIPQIPGSLRRSRPVRGVAEGLLKTKRYLFTLLVIQPEAPAVLGVLYLWHGRWKVGAGSNLWPDAPQAAPPVASTPDGNSPTERSASPVAKPPALSRQSAASAVTVSSSEAQSSALRY